jgi:hypothetical protein
VLKDYRRDSTVIGTVITLVIMPFLDQSNLDVPENLLESDRIITPIGTRDLKAEAAFFNRSHGTGVEQSP